MRWRSSADEENARAWFAGLLTFALTLVVVAIVALLSSGSAGARTLGGGPVAGAGVSVAPLEDEAEAEPDWGEFEEEGEGDEFEEEGDEGEDDEAPSDCVLETARARVTAYAGASKLRLQLAYRAAEPAAVELDYRLRGGKGGLSLGHKRFGIGYSGVLRDSVELSQGELEKALAGREVTVSVRALGTSDSCRSRFTERLADRSASGHAVTWR